MEQQLTTTSPLTLLEMAIQKGTDLEQLSKLMDLQERWERKEAKKAYIAAKAEFQRNVPVIEKNKSINIKFKNGGGSMNYKHSELSDIERAIKIPCADAGLTYDWKIDDHSEPNLIKVTCIISHVAGHSEATEMKGEKDDSGQKNRIQQAGSTITYLQRYTLIAALGLTTASTDNDGHTGQSEDNTGESTEDIAFDPATMIINFGKHAKDGKKTLWKDLPIDYLEWLRDGKDGDGKDKAKLTLAFLSVGAQQPAATTPAAVQTVEAGDPNDPYQQIYEDDPHAIDELVYNANTVKQLTLLYFRNQKLIESLSGLKESFTDKKKILQENELNAARDRSRKPQQFDF